MFLNSRCVAPFANEMNQNKTGVNNLGQISRVFTPVEFKSVIDEMSK